MLMHIKRSVRLPGHAHFSESAKATKYKEQQIDIHANESEREKPEGKQPEGLTEPEKNRWTGTARATPSAPITTPAVPASGNTFAIEIKPKQGWFPSDDVRDLFRRKLFEQQLGATPSPATSAETRHTAAAAPEATHPTTAMNVATTHEDVATKIATHSAGCSREKATTMCRYCAMQYLKLKRHKIDVLSAYCPMDLFSGITTRMTSALSALFECPQNNLRIFHNGNLIYGDHSASMSWNDLNEHVFKDDMLQMVQKLLVACLLRNYEEQDEHDEEEKAKGKKEVKKVEKEKGIKNASKVEKGSGTDFVAVAGTTKTDAAVAFIEKVAGQSHPSETLECNKKDKKAKKRKKTKKKKKKNNGEKNNKDELIPFEYPKKRKQEALKRRQKRKKREKRDEQKPKKCREPQVDKGNEEEEEGKPERIPTQIIEAELFCLPKKSVLHKVLQLQLLAKRHLLFMCDTENQRLADNSTKSYETLAQLLSGDAHAVSLSRLPPAQQYLIGATALDCSVMVTFAEVAADAERPPPHSRRNLVHLMDYNKTFVTEVTLLDLDPKPDNHCDKYIQQTVEAYQSCAESLGEELFH